ncbi:DUF1697 domain-containing protein [Shewanella sp. AS16]|uniref:DUF1697 domain-containing protein n=1 Tax=Shewanella sp. AS16 TaxID=2907625 RepID=UPI001F39BE08|nr:DUF1697 domain-containing protein [Shewanella sp. AS16]MCE9687572.1 DUF1697 domain-containing protein [Shewanella sp. AS16]
MKTYIVLFRAINVGGKNVLPMKELVSLLEALGFEGVKSYIQSGNLILKGNNPPGAEVVAALEARFGFRPEMMTLEKSEFDACVANNPFVAAEGKTLHCYFCNESPRLNQERLEQLAADTEEYRLIDRVFYLRAPNGIGRSKLVANLESCLGVKATGRNLNTVNKLQQMSVGV